MEAQNALKVDNGAQRLESPLDVLSRAASMIQKESSKVTEGNKAKDGKDFVTYCMYPEITIFDRMPAWVACEVFQRIPGVFMSAILSRKVCLT